MGKIVKSLIPATIFLIPIYFVRFEIFGIPTNVLEISVLICFGLSILGRTDKTDRTDRTHVLAIFLILAGLLISTLMNDNWRAGFGIIKGWFIIPLISGWILMKKRKGKEWLKSILKWLYFSVFLVAAISLVYYFSGSLTYDGRLKAFYLSPNHLAMYLAPGLIIGIYLIQSAIFQAADKTRGRWRQLAYASRRHPVFLFHVLFFLIILSSLYLTYSYAAWLAVILSLAITSVVKYKKINRRVFLISLIIVLLILVSQWNTEKFENFKNFSRSSLKSRTIIWQSAGKILKDNLIFGIGPGNFQNKYLEYQKHFPPYLEWAVPQPHNLYLAFWLQSGIIGLVGFIILIFKWIKNLVAPIKKQKNGADIAAVLLGVMFYILLHGLVDTTYWKNDLAMVFWVIFSLGLVMRNLDTDAV